MRKSFFDKRLCSSRRLGGGSDGSGLGESEGRSRTERGGFAYGRCGGFTLSELVVAVGILALMMVLAGEVFSVAVKSTGQAMALTTVSQRLRLFEQTLRADLAAVSPDSTIMVIQSNPIRAYWTPEDRRGDADGDPTNGYVHRADPQREDPNKPDGTGGFDMTAPRADMLMFVTERAGRSVVNPKVTALAQQVVYGHAMQIEYAPDPMLSCPTIPKFKSSLEPSDYPEKELDRQFPGVEISKQTSALPASQWHLARRALLLTNDAATENDDCLQLDDDHLFSLVPNSNGDYPVEAGLRDFVFGFDYEANVTSVVGVLPPDSKQEVDLRCSGNYTINNLVDYTYAGLPGAGEHSRGDWIRRSILDVTLPAPIADRIGHYFLPHCASFKVEWTFDQAALGVGGDRVLWVDYDRCTGLPGPSGLYRAISDELDRAEDLRGQGGIPDASKERFGARVDALRRLLFRFEQKDQGNDWFDPRFPKSTGDPLTCKPNLNYADIPGIFWFPRSVWVTGHDDADARVCTPRRDPYFPVALRITLDVYDENRRLNKPVRHVMVLPVGSR